MDQLVELMQNGDIAIIKVDNPPVDALSPAVLEAISCAINQIAGDDGIKAAVIRGGGRNTASSL